MTRIIEGLTTHAELVVQFETDPSPCMHGTPIRECQECQLSEAMDALRAYTEPPVCGCKLEDFDNYELVREVESRMR